MSTRVKVSSVSAEPSLSPEEVGKYLSLLEARLNDYENLRRDDPTSPEISSLRQGLEPLWQDMPPLLALFEDLRWPVVEKEFSQGLAALRCFAFLGPLHAGMARRFGRLASFIIGEFDSDKILFSLFKGKIEQTEQVESFFSHVSEHLHWAAETSCSLNGRFTGEERLRQAEDTLIESYGVSALDFRAQTKEIRRDLRKLVKLIWRQMATDQARPPLVFVDRFTIPGIDGLNNEGSIIGVYQPLRHNRIVFSLPVINNLFSGASHLLPAKIPAGLSLADLVAWEPCKIDEAKMNYDLAGVAIHELTHALSFKANESLTPSSIYWTDFEYFCQSHALPIPRLFSRTGLAVNTENRQGVAEICTGLTCFNEVLTEAAAMEIRAQIADQIPSALTTPQPKTDSPLYEQPYRQGLDLLTEFLPGLSPLAVLLGDQPAERLATGITKRLSKRGAKEALRLLCDSEYFTQELSRPGVPDTGDHLGLWYLLRQIIKKDDLRKIKPA
jgi:hypothetical protein